MDKKYKSLSDDEIQKIESDCKSRGYLTDDEKNKIFNHTISEKKKLEEVVSELTSKCLPALESTLDTLKQMNKVTGAQQRYDDIKEEILLKGWSMISRLYKPESNKSDPAAEPLYVFYQFVYDDMKRKGEI